MQEHEHAMEKAIEHVEIADRLLTVTQDSESVKLASVHREVGYTYALIARELRIGEKKGAYRQLRVASTPQKVDADEREPVDTTV